MHDPTRLARAAGLAHLCMVLTGGWAHLRVRANVHVPGDAAATASALVADADRFRLALAADLAMATAFVAVGVLLFLLFRRADRGMAGLLVLFVSVGAGLIVANLLLHEAALLVASDPTYAAVRTDELVLLLVDLHAWGYRSAGIFFGLWLLPLSVLGWRSRLLPRLLSALLAVAGVSWIVDAIAGALVPDLPATVQTLLTAPTFAELLLVAYLLVKGVRTPLPVTRGPAAPALER